MPQPRAPRFPTLFLLRTLPHSHSHRRSIYDGTLKPLRDRGLDHAVEREKNLKPLHALKTLIALEPSKSLPLSLLKRSPQLPFRPIDFIRQYPSVFHEFLPTAAATLPHVRLTAEALRLHADEHLLLHSDGFKRHAADRLLKLLMIARVHKLPLPLLDRLRWDLGLPPASAETLAPEFPDCFRAAAGFLELVCWSHDLAVSVLENRNRERKGELLSRVVFPVQFSNGFEMDKKYEKWLREWQQVPYVSPYENVSHLRGSSDEYDKWVVGVLHEILHVFVGKKVEKDCLLELGEWLGLRARFKRAILQHPGIFYVSSKSGTYTVVLREGYRRGSLVEDNPVVSLRNQYVHLMNSVREEGKVGKVVQGKGGVDEAKAKGVEGGGEGEGGGESGEASEEEVVDDEDASEMDVGDDDDDIDEKRSRRGGGNIGSSRRGREFGKVKLDVDKPLRDSRRERSPLRDSRRESSPLRDSRRERSPLRDSRRESSPLRDSRRERSPLRDFQRERLPLRGSHRERSPLRDSQRERGRDFGKVKLESDKPLRDSRRERSPLGDSQRERSPLRNSRRERSFGKTGEKNSLEFSKRRQVRGARKDVDSTHQRSRSSEGRGMSLTSKKAPVL
ncbi:protein WHAT'S THIS FACTOR 9, mitochondrial [Cajanus cajan]|uniref:PORR domain-containing protein n=1 Tax=Cajanus cajan TaxID=3821 RepID=A0A151QZ01_CAJCA|nr:protein WHAT'S THIS FACTOR 9, mitochondrial [Cajanus cajan]XP_020206255.1 protein WHAT'S THIS FACTOR 9, mitochondrial [Cajanus cajan]KYP35506.1 hypothetical protein KK1_043456 [Cajanus cajan]